MFSKSLSIFLKNEYTTFVIKIIKLNIGIVSVKELFLNRDYAFPLRALSYIILQNLSGKLQNG